MTRIQRRLLLDTSVIGVTLTLFVVILFHTTRVFQPLEDWFYDRRARLCQFFTPKPTDRLIHIDIDDSSIESIGHWPWDRAVMGELIDEIQRAGAKAISLDIIYPEASKPRYEPTPNGGARRIDDDAILGDALARSGRGHVPVAFEPYRAPGPVASRLREYLTADLELSEADCYKRLLDDPAQPLPPGAKSPTDVYVNARRQALRDRIRAELDAGRVSSADAPSRWTAWAAALPARVLRGEHAPPPRADADPAVDELRRLLLPRTDRDFTASPLIRLLGEEYRRVLALRELDRFLIPPAPGVPGLAKFDLDKVPIFPIMRAAGHTGFVNYFRIGDTSTIRAMPLVAEYRGRLFPQADLALACAVLGVDPKTIRLRPDAVVIPRPPGRDRDIVIPVRTAHAPTIGGDVAMFMDVPDRGRADWETVYDPQHKQPALHLPMGVVWAARQLGDRIARNNASIDKAVSFILEGNPLDQADVRLAIDPGRGRQYALHRPDLQDTAARREIVEWTRAQLEESMMLELLKMTDADFELPADQKFKTPEERAEAYEWLVRRKRHQRDELRFHAPALSTLFEQNVRLQDQLARTREQLKANIDGRAVLIGWVGTGGIDAYPTAVHPYCPGVVIRGLTYNAIMTGDFWRHAPRWVTTLVTVLVSLAVVAANGFLKPTAALFTALGIGAAYLLVNGLLLFDKFNLIVGVAPPVVALAAVWSTGALAAFLIEAAEHERVKRRFRSYVDQKLVDYVIENPDTTALKGQVREMSVIFTDLAGFTTLAEQLGERTVAILSEYLSVMVPVIRRHDGFVNKFLGDGIMCFYNAPTSDPDHAVHAVQTALDMQAAMTPFADALVAQGLPRVAMRCGVATGTMIVGDSGPADASDYTVLGDNVNFASRIEGANKATGTRILISQRTSELLGDRFLLRPVGRLQVVGKKEGVMTYEPLAPLDQATESDRQQCALCAEMVAAYVARDFATCVAAADRMDAQFHPTKLTTLYRRTARQYLETPPGPDFTGNLVLTEK
jgi:class 3 adenylate cyclase